MTSLLESLITVIAPHSCLSCSKENNILCSLCVENITGMLNSCCFNCMAPTHDFAVCVVCRRKTALSHVWVSGEYEATLKKLIKRFKFGRTPAAAEPLAEMLHAILPVLPEDCVIVPVPTSSRHIRQRGYDHALLLAQLLSQLTGRDVKLLLQRVSQQRQVGSSRSQRVLQASTSFQAKDSTGKHILLVDDVITTGATLKAAAQVLSEAGASTIWAATAARQAAGKQK